MKLAGRVAVVTGGGKRIGKAIACCLARDGAAVVVNARISEADVNQVVDEIRAQGGQAIGCLADVSDPAAVDRMMQIAVDAFGRIDILVNNAAIRPPVRIADLTLEKWRAVTSVILDGSFLCARAALPHLIASGHGRIINIGGLSAQIGSYSRAHVVSAKAGLIGLTRALARECGPDGVTVNCVSPGLIEDPSDPPAEVAFRRGHLPPEAIPLGRSGEPDDIARLVSALSGDDLAYISGQTIHVNGGAYLW